MTEQAETQAEAEEMTIEQMLSTMMGVNPRENGVKVATQTLCEVMAENKEYMDTIGTLTQQVSGMFAGHNSAIVAGVVVNIVAALAGDMYKHQSKTTGEESFDVDDAHMFVEAIARLTHMATNEACRLADGAEADHDD